MPNNLIGTQKVPTTPKCLQTVKIDTITCVYLISDVLPDDPRAFHGHPVGLQVMCRRLEEETCLKLAEIITNAIQQHNLQSRRSEASNSVSEGLATF